MLKFCLVEFTYIYYITERCNLVHFSIGLAFKTVFYGKTDIYFKIDSEYYGGLILRQQNKINKQITNN